MSDDVLNNAEEVVETVEVEEQVSEETTEELVENEEILDEEVEALEEGKHEDEEEEHEPKKETVQTPKTKAGVIQAAVEMLKKAKKEDAQKMFAKLVTIDGEEESIKSADDASNAVKGKMPEPKAKAKVESIDFEEDIDAIIKEEATLSDGFRDKASAIFEAVLTSKLSEEIDRLEAEYAQNLEEEVSEVQTSLVEKVDSYLNYVVSNWMEENEVAINNGLRTEIAEDFMTPLQQVFKEHYVEVPEGKVDLVDELSAQVSELEESLNKSTEDNIKLTESVSGLQRSEIVRRASSDLALTEAEKLASLVEDIDFDDAESFEMKVNVIKESYFKSETAEVVSDVQEVVGTDEAPADISDVMARYTQAITKFSK